MGDLFIYELPKCARLIGWFDDSIFAKCARLIRFVCLKIPLFVDSLLPKCARLIRVDDSTPAKCARLIRSEDSMSAKCARLIRFACFEDSLHVCSSLNVHA